MSVDILCIGEPLAEFNATRGDGGYLFGFGGDTSNAAIAAARQGACVGYVTALGDDEAGHAFRALWAREGIDASCVRTDRDAATGIYFVSHGESGHRFSYLRNGSAASRLTPRDIPFALLRRAKALHVSAISQAISTSACDAVFAAIEAARARGRARLLRQQFAPQALAARESARHHPCGHGFVRHRAPGPRGCARAHGPART